MAEVKKVEPEVKKPIKKFMDCTLEELVHKMGNIQLKDIVGKDNTTVNFSWIQIINTVNYLAGSNILSWKSTVDETLKAISTFLV
jgi:hypothetical protein